ncbi:MAG TPA: sulfite exporter TauE/SafE family protein [Candidatus Limnocylindrales bacterium]
MIAGLVLVAGGAAAGLFGSLLGLGGGVLLVPLLTLVFGVPLREAVAVSLVAVIVTSTAGAGVYLRRHVANLRLGMVLELFAAMGALAGGTIAFVLDEQVLAGLFAVVLTWVALSMARQGRRPTEPAVAGASADTGAERATDDEEPAVPALDAVAGAVALDGDDQARPETLPAPVTFADTLGGDGYRIGRLRFGMLASIGAGLVSALLGVGGGIVKVPVMNVAMGVPLKVATATSNMMIGITATSSAVIYLLRGEINPFIAGPTAVGVFIGASIGSRIAGRLDVRFLRWLFVIVVLYTAFEMARRALGLG